MSGRLPARALLLVALVAALARGLFELQARGGEGPVAVLAGHLLGDERAFDLTARAFADGSLLRERSFYHEPLYPWLLGLAYRVAPPPPLPAGSTVVPLAAVHAGVIALQHLLGVLACVLVAALGARAVSPRVGLLAGLLAALCGPLVFVEGQLLKEGPALLLSVLALHLWLDVLEDKGPRRAALLGLLLGLGVLLRGNTYLLLAAVLGSLLLRIGGRRRPRAAALVLGCTLLALAPATVHNLHLGELVLSTYQGGSNAAIGMPDDDRPWGGFTYEPLRMGRSDTLFEEEDAVALAEAAAGRRLSGPEVSGFWWRRTLDVVVHRPAVALQRVARRSPTSGWPARWRSWACCSCRGAAARARPCCAARCWRSRRRSGCSSCSAATGSRPRRRCGSCRSRPWTRRCGTCSPRRLVAPPSRARPAGCCSRAGRSGRAKCRLGPRPPRRP